MIDETVGRLRLPDGSDRFVVDERYLVDKTCVKSEPGKRFDSNGDARMAL